MKAFFSFLFSFIAVALLALGALALDVFARQDLVLPRTMLGNFPLGGMSRGGVSDFLKEKLNAFLETPFQIAARGQVQEATLKELGVFINESVLTAAIPFAGGMSAPEMALWSVAGQRINPGVGVERVELLRVLHEKFPDIPAAQNARFVKKGKTVEIIEAQNGLTPKFAPLLAQLSQNIRFLEHQPLVVEFEDLPPTVFAADLEKLKDRLSPVLDYSLKLAYETQTFAIDFSKHPDWLGFQKKPYEVSDNELSVSVQWDELAFAQFINENVSAKLEQAPEDVKISQSAEGKIVIEGHGNEGKAIEREKLLLLANQAISKLNAGPVEIPLVTVTPKVEVISELQELGIRELVAIGHTKFAGSPKNRIHNIGVGISRYNGLLIPPGATFSFNENLGVVDETTGYRKELVIKPEGTIPEFGGGLCQVSTTLFRAAINAGISIKERAPHSYAVTYYSQVGGHGLDATIYPPARDLKFINDTPGHLLIQSYTEGMNAYFKLYGTSDGRTVTLDGPYISNRLAAPSEPVYVPDKALKGDEKKQVQKPYAGFDALWYRSITKNGETLKEAIKSRYKAMPAKYLVADKVTAEGENQGLTEGANPFE